MASKDTSEDEARVENLQAYIETVKRQFIEENHDLKSRLPDDAEDKPLGQEYEMLIDEITTLWKENINLQLQSIHLENNKRSPKIGLKEMLSKLPQIPKGSFRGSFEDYVSSQSLDGGTSQSLDGGTDVIDGPEQRRRYEEERNRRQKLVVENQLEKEVEKLENSSEQTTKEQKINNDEKLGESLETEEGGQPSQGKTWKERIKNNKKLGENLETEEGGQPSQGKTWKEWFRQFGAGFFSVNDSLSGNDKERSAGQCRNRPAEHSEKQNAKRDDQAKASATCHCPMSCARESFLGLAEDICPRRALLDIYVLIALDLVKSSLKEKGRWPSLYDGFYKDVWEMCGSLKCNDFLPLLEKKKYIKLIIEIDRKNLKDIPEIKEKLEAAFKKIVEAKDDCVVRHKGPQKLVEAIKYSCILVYVYKTDDGKTVVHCVQVRFDEACKVEKTQFIDSLKPETLENIVRKNLVKIQVLRLTENVHNLYQECGKHLCKEETCTKNAESMYARKKPPKRRASAEW